MNSNASSKDHYESQRLEALAEYGILDTAPEGEFDEVVRLAAQLCEVPIATITLVDGHRQWFKARIGLALVETPRDIAFCALTIQQREPLIVPDARNDTRFFDNPLVRGEPNLRFYAGFPLATEEDFVLGTLSVMDQAPRQLTEDKIFALKVLAHQVVARLELRRSLAQLGKARENLLEAKRELEAAVMERTRQLSETSAAHASAERLYRLLWETTTDAVVILDARSALRYANPSAQRIFGHPTNRLVGSSLALLQPPRLREAHRLGLQRYIQTGEKRVDWRAAETVGLRADGSEFPIEIAFSEFTMEGERFFVGFIRDITARKEAEAALIEEKERAQTTLRCIGDAVISTDEFGRITFVNPLAERLTGWNAKDVHNRRYDKVLQLLDESSGASLTSPSRSRPMNLPQVLPPGTVLRRRDGEILPVEGSVARIVAGPERFAGWVIAIRDVSESRRMLALISHQASHDALTGLVNRSEFDRRLRMAIERASAEGVEHSMLYLDMDQFKVVNDTCGHVAGDELLKQVSAMLALNLRKNDTLARLGGDEFGVLLENCGVQTALRIAEKLRQAVEGFSFAWNGQVFGASTSIGHVHFDDHSLTLTDVLSKADEACYVAKDHGRNRIQTYRLNDRALALRHGEMEWLGELRQAMEEDRMELYAQPIFAVREGAPVNTHLEVLLRMRDRSGNLVAPMAFIPAAERYNLMTTLDRWVLRAVLQRIAKPTTAVIGEPCFAINLSGASVGDPTLADYVKTQLSLSGVPPAWVCFEVTETAAIANLTQAAQFIHEVKEAGCRFALDDFGSGMSSFGYLKHLPVDFLKIDGAFVRDLATDAIDRAMVASINEIGHLMGLLTVAEFVETDPVMQELRKIGVDYAQGYGLARPAPFE